MGDVYGKRVRLDHITYTRKVVIDVDAEAGNPNVTLTFRSRQRRPWWRWRGRMVTTSVNLSVAGVDYVMSRLDQVSGEEPTYEELELVDSDGNLATLLITDEPVNAGIAWESGRGHRDGLVMLCAEGRYYHPAAVALDELDELDVLYNGLRDAKYLAEDADTQW